MFLFKCCQQYDSGVGYQVKTRNQKNEEVVKFVTNLDDLKQNEIIDRRNRIIRIEKSQYDQLMAKYKGKDKLWTDPQFPPVDSSIGQIDGVNTKRWRRISEILPKNPVLFDGKVEPRDVIQGSLGDCYFLSALAALAENQQRIKSCFGNQQFNPNGIYKVTLRIDGIIQQILIDDYIPVNSEGDPLFCQPNKNQFWVLILQKAWAKAHGSYANIVAGSPTEVFKAVTFAPSQLLMVKEGQDQRDKLWQKIVEHAKKDHPCCCGTDDNPSVDWAQLGLVPGHAYTLINAAYLTDNQGKNHRMMKIRNPWGQRQWEGQGNQNDTGFWDNIENTGQKQKFLGRMPSGNDGVFYMTYQDFCKYFTQTHFCMLQQNANYVSEKLYCNRKNGSVYEVVISEKDYYTFQLHQSGVRGQDAQKQEEGVNRGTIVVAHKTGNEYTFVDGALSYYQQDVSLRCFLEVGTYVFYAKLDPTRKRGLLPQSSSVSIYSQDYVKMRPATQKDYPNLLQKIFLSHGRQHKRQQYNNDLMWISWKLLYQQGGYAYIALGNDRQSNKKFILSFNESDFGNMNFVLKKTFKGKGDEQTVQVLPGQEKVILARVKNIQVKSMKFPPPLGIKMQVV